VSGHPIRQGDLHRRPGGDDAVEAGQVSTPVVESVANNSSEINPAVLAIWLAVQFGALALAAWRVPLAAQYPQPAEFQAVRVLVAVQCLAAAMLCPVLLRGWRMALVAIVTAGIFIFFAGGLSAWSMREPLYPAVYVALWLATLFVWVKVVGKRQGHLIPAISAVYAGGGPLLWYLGQDLGSGDRMLSQLSYGSLLPVLVSPQSPTSAGWLSLSLLFFTGVTLNFVGRLRRA
jgi:hypothetical protein